MTEALQVQQRGELLADEVLQPVMNLQVAKKRLAEFQEFVKEYLKEGEDFGTIPGTPKPTLYKPGADKLCELYGLADAYEIVDKIEDFDAPPPLFDYTIRCTLTRIRTQLPIASGLGSCNSYESRYRYRQGTRKCPKCMKEAIIKGKEEYGGGWLCFDKKGGCKAKFAEDDPAITKQSVGRVENEDIADIKNTILKMAKKRAKIDATLAATRSSGVFTQDVEDIPGIGSETTPPPSGRAKTSTKKSTVPAEDVVCSECRATNSHSPKCSFHPDNKQQSAPPASQEAATGVPVYQLTVDKVETRQTKNKANYGVLSCHDGNGVGMVVNVFHATPQKYMGLWVGKVCEMEIQSKPSAQDANKTLYTLDKIHRAGDVRYENNQPAVPEGFEMDFEPQ